MYQPGKPDAVLRRDGGDSTIVGAGKNRDKECVIMQSTFIQQFHYFRLVGDLFRIPSILALSHFFHTSYFDLSSHPGIDSRKFSSSNNPRLYKYPITRSIHNHPNTGTNPTIPSFNTKILHHTYHTYISQSLFFLISLPWTDTLPRIPDVYYF